MLRSWLVENGGNSTSLLMVFASERKMVYEFTSELNSKHLVLQDAHKAYPAFLVNFVSLEILL